MYSVSLTCPRETRKSESGLTRTSMYGCGSHDGDIEPVLPDRLCPLVTHHTCGYDHVLHQIIMVQAQGKRLGNFQEGKMS